MRPSPWPAFTSQLTALAAPSAYITSAAAASALAKLASTHVFRNTVVRATSHQRYACHCKKRATHARIDNHILSAEEDCKLARIMCVWNLIEEDVVVGPFKVLESVSVVRSACTHALDIVCDPDFGGDEIVQ